MTVDRAPPAFPHQKAYLDRAALRPSYALFWDMGLGKSRAMVETYKSLLTAGKVKRLAVIAPNGLHQAWIYGELAKSLPDVPAMAYDTHKSGKRWLRELALHLTSSKPAVFTISYDALLTKRGKDALETFVTVEPCLLVADESSRIKNPKAKRTKIALKLSTLAAYRRILTGTPASNSPFDLYSQFLFLAQDFWSRQGIASWWAFRSRYGKFEQSYIFCHGASRDFMKLVGYQNESDLATRIAPVSSRLRLADCINMPERIYKTITFDLAPEARRLYNSLRTEFYAAIDTRMMTAALALTRMLRLQQIASGILTTDDGVTTAMPCGRLEILKEILEDGGTAPTLVWTRFIPTAMAAMALLGARARRFDGSVSEADRQTALADFALGKFQFLVINLASGSFGFNMQTATRSIFLERSFAAEQRQQAEARNYRIGQTLPTIVIDIVAQDTVDGHILEALARKEDISKKILGGDLARAKNLV